MNLAKFAGYVLCGTGVLDALTEPLLYSCNLTGFNKCVIDLLSAIALILGGKVLLENQDVKG